MRLVSLATLDAFVEVTIYPSRRLTAGSGSPRDRFFVEAAMFHLDFGSSYFDSLVVMNINTMTFAAREFKARRGASDEHIPQWICKKRATKSGRKRTAARR